MINWIFLIAVMAVFSALFFFLKKQMQSEMEIRFSKISQEALKAGIDQILLLAKDKFESKQNEIHTELSAKKEAIDKTVQNLEGQLQKYELLIRGFEKDRGEKYGSLANELKNASLVTTKLQETTGRLNNILGNVKLRGQWGERMAEDIIKNCGLIEGINFRKQKKLDSAATKPDYTFLLPDNHTINMDVKFPLNNYIHIINTENEYEREQFKKEFSNNVKMRKKKITNRDYISPEEETLDFVLLFIPNEKVFGFIQEHFPGLIDEALKQKVVLCSPFTLYAMLCVIRQAFENFRYEKATKEIVKMIELFAKTYGIFKTRFDVLGEVINKVDDQYNQIKNTSFKELDTKIRRIEDYKKGNVPSVENKENKNHVIDIAQNDLENEKIVS